MSSFGIPVRNGLGVGLLASTSLSTRNSSAVAPFTPASLFTAGESGYWLDPSDFSTMWQDSQGVTPVTATGQTCGLILDKSIGTRTQVFDDANVTFTGTAGYAGRISPGVYEYAREAVNSGSVVFGGLVSGRTYLISLQVAAYAGAIPGITITAADFRSALNASIRPAAVGAGTYTAFYVADGATFRIGGTAPGAGGTISNVSILEVPGNHALQATAAERPITGVEPSTGRRNLLLQTGLTGATSGTPGTAPTGWPLLVSNGTTAVIPSGGSLGGDAIRLSAVANRQLYSQSLIPMAASSVYTFSVQCDVHTSINVLSFANLSAIPAGTTLEYLIDGVVVPSGTALPLGPCVAGVRATTSTTAGVAALRLGIGTGGNATGDVTFWDPQLELGSTRTDYQRVTDQWNVTEAGTTPCYYLAFDGTDDRLVLPFPAVRELTRTSVLKQVSWTLNDQPFSQLNNWELRQFLNSPELVVRAPSLQSPPDAGLPLGVIGVTNEASSTAANTVSLQINNGVVGSTLHNPGVIDPQVGIGARTGGTLAANVFIYETVSRVGLMTGTELTDLKSYYYEKYEITP